MEAAGLAAKSRSGGSVAGKTVASSFEVDQRQAHLPEVVFALAGRARLAGRLNRRQQQRHQHPHDGDHHQQFDQGKTMSNSHGTNRPPLQGMRGPRHECAAALVMRISGTNARYGARNDSGRKSLDPRRADGRRGLACAMQRCSGSQPIDHVPLKLPIGGRRRRSHRAGDAPQLAQPSALRSLDGRDQRRGRVFVGIGVAGAGRVIVARGRRVSIPRVLIASGVLRAAGARRAVRMIVIVVIGFERGGDDNLGRRLDIVLPPRPAFRRASSSSNGPNTRRPTCSRRRGVGRGTLRHAACGAKPAPARRPRRSNTPPAP